MTGQRRERHRELKSQERPGQAPNSQLRAGLCAIGSESTNPRRNNRQSENQSRNQEGAASRSHRVPTVHPGYGEQKTTSKLVPGGQSCEPPLSSNE
jgi:hypothetical protein